MKSNNILLREAYAAVQETEQNSRNWFLTKPAKPVSGSFVFKSPRNSITFSVTFQHSKMTDVKCSARGAQVDLETANAQFDSGKSIGDSLSVAVFYPADLGRDENDILYGDTQPLPASTPGDTTHNNGSVQ